MTAPATWSRIAKASAWPPGPIQPLHLLLLPLLPEILAAVAKYSWHGPENTVLAPQSWLSAFSPHIGPHTELATCLASSLTWLLPLGTWYLDPGWAPFSNFGSDSSLDPSTLDHVYSYCVSLPSPGRHEEEFHPSCIGCLYIPSLLTGRLLHRCLSQGPYCNFPLQKAGHRRVMNHVCFLPRDSFEAGGRQRREGLEHLCPFKIHMLKS